MRDAAVSGALVCFVLGGRLDHLAPPTLLALGAETERHRDFLWLNETRDGCGARHLPLAKPFSWWRAASTLLATHTALRHAIKVDDDTVLVLPRLAADLSALSCVTRLYYGPMLMVCPPWGVHYYVGLGCALWACADGVSRREIMRGTTTETAQLRPACGHAMDPIA